MRSGPGPRSIPPIALLFPWVAVVVVAVGLPEAGLVVVAQLEAADPLRALPEVQMRDQQPRRAAVLGLERLPPVLVGDPRPAAGQILERQVGRIAAVTPRGDIAGAGIDIFEQGVDRPPGPGVTCQADPHAPPSAARRSSQARSQRRHS